MGNRYDSLKLTHVRVEIRDKVGVIILNRPEKRNAFTTRMSEELPLLYKALDEDPQVRVIVVTGAPNPGKAFCAGADLSIGNFSSRGVDARADNKNNAPTPSTHRDGGGKVTLAAINVKKPVIAAINGHAVGVGITMTLPLDIRITWKNAKIGFVFARRGIVPEAVSTYFLPRLIGHASALALLTRGEVLPASHPIHGNLFYQLLDSPDDVLPAAMELANEMANSNSSLSMAVIKSLCWRSESTPEGQHLLDSRAMNVLGNTNESQELVKAFLQKHKGPLDDNKRTTVDDWPETLPKWWTVPDVRPNL